MQETLSKSLLNLESWIFILQDLFLVGKKVLIVMVPILINKKDVFELSYDLKLMVRNSNYFCTNIGGNQGFTGSTVVKNLPSVQETWVRDLGSRPGLNPWVGKIPWRREWQSTPVFFFFFFFLLQYSCLEIPMDRGAWQATVHGVTDCDRTELPTHTR